MRVRDVLEALTKEFPLEWADPWDRVGLRIGDPDAEARCIYVTLDADAAALDRAAEHGCGALVAHHPPFLRDLGAVVADSEAGSLVLKAAATGVAVVSMHTNLDRSPAASAAFAAACGFEPARPLESGSEEVDLVTLFAPAGSQERIIDAMSAAGAGRIGLYERCAFTSDGIGLYTPLPGSAPVTGTIGPTSADEVRIEMVAPAGRGPRVAAAARAHHPYEEPLIIVSRVTRPRSRIALGCICDTDRLRLEDLATTIGKRLGVRARVWGTRSHDVTRIAFATGSGSSMIGHALEAGASALVLGEVRYHDAVSAVSAGLGIVETGHDVSELPLVRVMADVLCAAFGSGAVIEDKRRQAWWTTGEAAR